MVESAPVEWSEDKTLFLVPEQFCDTLYLRKGSTDIAYHTSLSGIVQQYLKTNSARSPLSTDSIVRSRTYSGRRSILGFGPGVIGLEARSNRPFRPAIPAAPLRTLAFSA